MIDYDLRTLPAAGDLTDDARGWAHAVALGFGQAALSDEALERWWGYQCADRFRLRSAWPTGPTPGLAPHTPVATFASFDQTINTGNRHLEPANFITDVTVRTTHRRRGLLSRLMRTDLGEAADRGLALASLTATEGSIYGRFGFGVSSLVRTVELHTGARFGLRPEASGLADLPVEIVDSATAAPLLERTFAAYHAERRGSHGRMHWYGDYLTGLWNHEEEKPDRRVRVAVAFDAGGEPRGHVSYRFDGHGERLKVIDLVAADPAAELSLWRFLASVDLVDVVEYGHFDAASPLPSALADPRLVVTTKVRDFTWTRVLDVPRALGARGFDADGEATFAVDDRLGFADGSWHVAVRDGVAETTRVEDAAVRITADALATLYAGLASARTLAGAGLITGDAAGVRALARLFAVDVPPACVTSF